MCVPISLLLRHVERSLFSQQQASLLFGLHSRSSVPTAVEGRRRAERQPGLDGAESRLGYVPGT